MQILFIGKRFYTNRDALTEKYGRIYQLPLYWAKAGHHVRLWLVDYHGKQTEYVQDNGMEVVSTPVRNLSLFKYWLSGQYKQHLKPDLVVASGDCYIGLLGLYLARRCSARFVFDVYDKYDEFGAYIKLPGFSLFDYLLDKADVRLFASSALKQRMQRSENDCFTPNGIDAEHFQPRDMRESRTKFSLPQDKKLIGYLGSFSADRGVEDLIAAVKKLRQHDSGIELVLAGANQIGLNTQLEGVHYLGNLPFKDVPWAMAACDVLTLPYRRSLYLDMASSCKINEYFAMQRRIVATRTPNLLSNFDLVPDSIAPFLAEPSNPDDLADKLRKQLSEPTLHITQHPVSWNAISENTLQKMI